MIGRIQVINQFVKLIALTVYNYFYILTKLKIQDQIFKTQAQ